MQVRCVCPDAGPGSRNGAVGFDQQPIQRQLADDLTLLFRVFIRDGSRDADVEIELQSLFVRFRDSRCRNVRRRVFLSVDDSARSVLVPFAEDVEQVNGCLPEPRVVLFTHVDDDRLIHILRELELLLENCRVELLACRFL